MPLPVEQAKILYASCMNTGNKEHLPKQKFSTCNILGLWEDLGLQPLYSLLEQLELPLNNFKNISNTASTFLSKLAKVHRTMNLDVFFRLKVDEEQDILQLSAPTLSGSLMPPR